LEEGLGDTIVEYQYLFFKATYLHIVSFSLFVTVISYLVGDRIILKQVGNRNALVIDFFQTYLLVWIFGSVLLNSYLQIAWGSILAAVLVTATETIVHRLMLNQSSEDQPFSFHPKMSYKMEMAKLEDPRDK
jgi:hypothetical protein